MLRNRETIKKTYLVPDIQVVHMDSGCFLAASEIKPERFNYLCPYIPETRCREYNRFARREHGIFSASSEVPSYNRISIKGDRECPRKDVCYAHQIYRNLTDGKKR